MKTLVEKIDISLKGFLQSNVEFCLKDKVIKKGKLLLFEHGHFNYIFTIQTKSKKTTLKIPFPFDYVQNEQEISFDYTMKTFTNDIPEIFETVEKIKIENPSKFFDNVLKIKSQKIEK